MVLILQRYEVVEFLSHLLEHEEVLPFFIFIVAVNWKTGNFYQAGESMVSEVVRGKHHDEIINEIRIYDIVHRDPAEEGVESFQASPDQGLLDLCHIAEDELTELKDSGKIRIHLILEFHDLMLCHLIFGMVKDFLTQHLQNVEIILADVHVFH